MNAITVTGPLTNPAGAVQTTLDVFNSLGLDWCDLTKEIIGDRPPVRTGTYAASLDHEILMGGQAAMSAIVFSGTGQARSLEWGYPAGGGPPPFHAIFEWVTLASLAPKEDQTLEDVAWAVLRSLHLFGTKAENIQAPFTKAMPDIEELASRLADTHGNTLARRLSG